jgi:hypothetical protein
MKMIASFIARACVQAGEKTVGTAQYLVYTEEQQKRLGVDEFGNPAAEATRNAGVHRTRACALDPVVDAVHGSHLRAQLPRSCTCFDPTTLWPHIQSLIPRVRMR